MWTDSCHLANDAIDRSDYGFVSSDAERQVLILASTGDLPLANIVARRHGIDWQRVRKEMANKKDHWACKAAHTTLLTCNVCLLPSWPDCDCAGRKSSSGEKKSAG